MDLECKQRGCSLHNFLYLRGGRNLIELSACAIAILCTIPVVIVGFSGILEVLVGF
jgi:hypothetical protein